MQAERDFIVGAAKKIIPVESISPFSGGKGEKERADVIAGLLSEMGYPEYSRFDVTDTYGKVRSNIVLKVGNCDRTLWLVSHIDTVPAGNVSDWKYPPFDVTVENGKMYGRGTADNGQGIFLSLLLLKYLRKNDLKLNLGLAFVADEEVGSKYGIQYLLTQMEFGRNDLFIVPDSGKSDGLEIEVAEKSILWLKATVQGKQYHASKPSNAVNSSREGMKFVLRLDKFLHENYNAVSDVFDPPVSTFEPTKHEKNVDNVNTIPGEDVFYIDCRILPQYDLENILADINKIAEEFQKTSESKLIIEPVQKEQAPPATSTDSEIFKLLSSAVGKVKGKEPYAIGIGGGTCAKFFRELNLDTVVWSTADDQVYHEVDEYCVLDYILQDRRVIEDMIYGQ